MEQGKITPMLTPDHLEVMNDVIQRSWQKVQDCISANPQKLVSFHQLNSICEVVKIVAKQECESLKVISQFKNDDVALIVPKKHKKEKNKLFGWEPEFSESSDTNFTESDNLEANKMSPPVTRLKMIKQSAKIKPKIKLDSNVQITTEDKKPIKELAVNKQQFDVLNKKRKKRKSIVSLY
ncbi:hypothetical protein BLOT_000798 [Blomia tropicalis]|nr:hypothetical protein BLOT_000798 [Blomia tropicalis]